MISNLPIELQNYILSYITGNALNIIFNIINNKNVYNNQIDINGYSDKYEQAYINGNKIYKRISRKYCDLNDEETIIEVSLSRIKKKNNKHRYYLTYITTYIEYDTDYVRGDRYRRPYITHLCESYKSKYIGKNIYHSLLYYTLYTKI